MNSRRQCHYGVEYCASHNLDRTLAIDAHQETATLVIIRQRQGELVVYFEPSAGNFGTVVVATTQSRAAQQLFLANFDRDNRANLQSRTVRYADRELEPVRSFAGIRLG